MIKRLILLILLSFNFVYAQEDQKTKNGDAASENDTGDASQAEKTVKIGNLAFPTSQQPNAFISFGQNILDKGQTQVLCLTNMFKGKNQYFTNVVPSLLYGITDELSIFISTPIAPRNKQDDKRSEGIEDLLIQFEYAYFTKAHKTFYDQATVLATVSFPTGSTRKDPNTGLGSPSFFVGGTWSRMTIDWFYFISGGGIITSSYHGTKFGDQILYQMGIGRRIASNENWLFDWMLEFDGLYSSKDKSKGQFDPNSGGNVIYLTPSLWISSKKHFILQIGAGYAVQQHWFGKQGRRKYLFALNLGWTF